MCYIIEANMTVPYMLAGNPYMSMLSELKYALIQAVNDISK